MRKDTLAAYRPPPIDPGIKAALDAFIDKRIRDGGVKTGSSAPTGTQIADQDMPGPRPTQAPSIDAVPVGRGKHHRPK